jgi:hypothetical protein
LNAPLKDPPMNRTKTLVKAGALGLAAVLAVPAAAQYGGSPQQPPPEGSHSNRRTAAQPAPATTTVTATAPAEVLTAVACPLAQDARGGDALMAAVPRSPEERTAAVAFLRLVERCRRGQPRINTSQVTLRGAIAETLLETQFATPPAARAPALNAKALVRPAPSDDAAIAELLPSYDLVDCTTPKRPDLIRALLATEPRSDAEIAALTALNPTFVTCVARGARLAIEPRAIRSMYAEALYHWSLVQRDGPASPWAAPAAATPPPA